VGQHEATIRVKFRPGSPLTLSEKVASSLVWRFGTFNCISDNLDCFKDGFGDSGSFLDVGGHRFYVAKPLPEEVTDVLDPLCDTGLDCSETSDLCSMVEVLALEEDGGGDLVAVPYNDLEAMVDAAIMVEDKNKAARESRKRRMMSQGGPSSQRSRSMPPSRSAPPP
jgi:hypothetical protein